MTLRSDVKAGFKISGIALLFIFFIQTWALAQTTTVEGTIKEENTGDPIIFAHIFFKGSGVCQL
jgi:hypothetical protein